MQFFQFSSLAVVAVMASITPLVTAGHVNVHQRRHWGSRPSWSRSARPTSSISSSTDVIQASSDMYLPTVPNYSPTVSTTAAQDTSTSWIKSSPSTSIPVASLSSTSTVASEPSYSTSSTTSVYLSASLSTVSSSSSSSSSTPSLATSTSAPTSTLPSAVPYTLFSGDGSPTSGWPDKIQWLEFAVLWELNAGIFEAGCEGFQYLNSLITLNSAAETASIRSAITKHADSSGVDARFILAVVIQESHGCVRAPSTANSVVNPGLMQSHAGQGSCNPDNSDSGILDPCPDEMVDMMIHDGVWNPASEQWSLKAALGGLGIAGAGADDLLDMDQVQAQSVYQAAVVYNSGFLPVDGLLENSGATRCYASDIANRLMGWSSIAGSTCSF